MLKSTYMDDDKALLVWLFESGIERLKAAGEDYGEFARALGNLQSATFSPAIKKEYGEQARVLYAHMAATLSAPNWQSPSFWHTASPQAGREVGTISASRNDYKRDMHADAKRYETAFVQEYVNHPMRIAPFAYVTSSGMSAVSTVLVHLQSSCGPDDVVLAGKSSYFQNKWLLQTLFPRRVKWVDEFDTDGILAAAQNYKPKIIFLDSLCGAETLPMPDLKTLVPALARIVPKETTLVLDNTVLSTMYQPLHDLPWNPLSMKLIVVESLLKFHEFGMDRVPGGIIWTPSLMESGLFHTRMHMGTIMPDNAVCAMPEPNRKYMDMRLLRIGQNARAIAETLSAALEGNSSVLEEVIHPSVPRYRGHAWTGALPFQGPFVTLRFKKRTVANYDAFIARVENIGKEKGIDLVGGTSFGFDTTRLYVTARYATDITEPFVRLSVGTESAEEIDALVDVLVAAAQA